MEYQLTVCKKEGTAASATGAEIIVETLKKAGVKRVFGYPGGKIIPVFDALYDEPEIEVILCRHEQAAVHAADGYARYSGNTGVCIVTSGPGATNTVTGLAAAKADSVPVVCISGQVETSLLGSEAFQEAEITQITAPVTKHSVIITEAEKVRSIIEQAFFTASSGRPGPVMVDLPVDIQSARCAGEEPEQQWSVTVEESRDEPYSDREKLFRHIQTFSKPLFFIGGGMRSGAWVHMQSLMDATGIPVVSSLMGLGSVPAGHHGALGMIGMHGSIPANLAVSNCDLIIGIGVRFEDRATGKIDTFAPKAEIIHVNIDPLSIEKTAAGAIPVVEDAGEFCRSFLQYIGEHGWQHRYSDWKHELQTFRAREEQLTVKYEHLQKDFHPKKIIKEVQKHLPDSPIITEVGQHQMWAAQYCSFSNPRQWITSGGQGTMGYGLPAAIGVQFAMMDTKDQTDTRRSVLLAGDGSIQMNLQELAVCSRYRLPVLIIIMNNGYLGMVRQWQELFFGRRYSATCLQGNTDCSQTCKEPGTGCPEYAPDFSLIARGFGIPSAKVDCLEDLQVQLDKFAKGEGPAVIECMINREENVWPIVPAGKGNHEMLYYGEEV